MTNSKEKDYFMTSPVQFIDNNTNNQKTLSIPIKKSKHSFDNFSKSWNGHSFTIIKNGQEKYSFSPSDQPSILDNEKREKIVNDIIGNDYRPYDAINNCKSAGIIPYALYNNKIYFLFQRTNNPIRKKDSGWNDFGGKRNTIEETTVETASREFSEETSCLFYLKENDGPIASGNSYIKSKDLYQLLKHNEALYYDEETINILRSLIPISQKYFVKKITEFVIPIHASSKETYISYFVKVEYIPSDDLPKAEDIHIEYEDRYMRTCKWFSYDEILDMDEKDFHKRLQITRIQQRIINYYEKGLFT